MTEDPIDKLEGSETENGGPMTQDQLFVAKAGRTNPDRRRNIPQIDHLPGEVP